jgi:hypothetical protein
MTNLEKLRTATPEQITDLFCEDCDKCPSFIFERCDLWKNGFLEWLNEEASEPKDAQSDAQSDAPKGWIKLKMEAIGNDVYINTSTIVGVSVRNGASEALTEIYTIGAEDSPWLVDESIDEVMKKIEGA